MNEITERQNQVVEAVEAKPVVVPSLSTEQGFALLQRQARMYSESELVPKQFQKNLGNCAIALQMADRIGADPVSVMQNLYIVHGTPSWSATFLIGCVNSCGRFSPLRYRFGGEPGKDSWSCVAYATDLQTGMVLDGTEVSIGMAKRHGWHGRKGSYWQSMPEQMLRYRSATYWTRAYAPEIGLGMRTVDEVRDIGPKKVQGETIGVAEIEQRLKTVETPGEGTGSEEIVPESGSQRVDWMEESAKASRDDARRFDAEDRANDARRYFQRESRFGPGTEPLIEGRRVTVDDPVEPPEAVLDPSEVTQWGEMTPIVDHDPVDDGDEPVEDERVWDKKADDWVEPAEGVKWSKEQDDWVAAATGDVK